MGLITLTTDFGANDWFVGTMKGVILGINPRATLVDITHNLCSGDIRAGAFALMVSHRFFPKHTVHLAVVDPGVGSARKAIAVQTADYVFVGRTTACCPGRCATKTSERFGGWRTRSFFSSRSAELFMDVTSLRPWLRS
jgi:hypothetical protein